VKREEKRAGKKKNYESLMRRKTESVQLAGTEWKERKAAKSELSGEWKSFQSLPSLRWTEPLPRCSVNSPVGSTLEVVAVQAVGERLE
jgi:hypothetical protein